MTSRRLRRIRRAESAVGLLAEARLNHYLQMKVELARLEAVYAVDLDDLWLDAARWTPELLEERVECS